MRFLYVMGGLLLACSMSACGGPDDLKDEQNQRHEDLQKRLQWTRHARLKAADSCADAEDALKESVRQEMELSLDAALRCWIEPHGCYDVDESVPGAAPPSAPDASDSPEDFSDTNVQVQGVDEADIVKTDGQDILGIFDNYLVASAVWPPEDLHETAHIALHGTPIGLYLIGDKVAVLSRLRGPGHVYGYGAPDSMGGAPLDNEPSRDPSGEVYIPDKHWPINGTLLTVVDRSDEGLRVVAQHAFEGTQLSSRRIGTRVYLALSHPRPAQGLSYYPDINIDHASEARIRHAFEGLRAKNLRVIDELSLDWWIPKRYTLDENHAFDARSAEPLTDCTRVYTSTDYNGAHNLVSVVTYDLQSNDIHAATVQGDWSTVYASQNAFYLAATNWGWSNWWTPSESNTYETLTQIHKFAFEDQGNADYVASGTVDGYTLNQFSLDEHQDHLRVATTTGQSWWDSATTSESHVTILQEHDGRLESTGMVSGLGVGESIYAVRFMGEKGYVVTFRQIDPLYVLDLSDPAHPTAAGELEIPGYSTYMHPLKDDQLLTIGRDADMDGRVGGLKLEIFDVSDPAAPTSVTTRVLGSDWGVQSEALYDHKAFMYFPARNLLAIPVSRWDADHYHYGSYRSELHVFRIDDDAIVPIGVIDHTALFDQDIDMSLCPVWPLRTYLEMRRGIFMDDILYSVSTDGIVTHDTRTLSEGPISWVIANPRTASALEEAREVCAP